LSTMVKRSAQLGRIKWQPKSRRFVLANLSRSEQVK
jgi:hypothetical protein